MSTASRDKDGDVRMEDGNEPSRDADGAQQTDYDRHNSRMMDAYPRVSARNMLSAVDAENQKRAEDLKERRARHKRSFEEAIRAAEGEREANAEPPEPNIHDEIPIGPLGLEEQDDEAFNRLCETFDHLNMMTVLAARLVRNCEREARQNRVVPFLQLLVEGRAALNQESGGELKMSEGEARYLRMSAALDEIARVAHLRKEHAQQTFITEFQIACAPLIYRNDWETNKVNFMTKNRLSRIDRMVLCMAPRRFGKTWAIAWFCLAVIWVLEQINIAIFSQNLRTSAAICQTLHQWLFRLPGGQERSCSDAKTRVAVITEEALGQCRMHKDKTKHPSRSSITALPCTVNGMAGLLVYTPLPSLPSLFSRPTPPLPLPHDDLTRTHTHTRTRAPMRGQRPISCAGQYDTRLKTYRLVAIHPRLFVIQPSVRTI